MVDSTYNSMLASANSTQVDQTQLPSQAKDVSDWLIQCLLQLDITHFFGLPGASIEPMYNSLARAQLHIRMKMILNSANF